MNMPSRRRIGAVALIVAGIGAFLVPFLLHSPSSPAATSGNNNGKDNTSSKIACSPGTIASGEKSTCRAAVPDTTTASNTPTGVVSFTSSDPSVGAVAASCTLSAGSCTADFTGITTGTATITGTYGGDSSHNGSSGTSDVIIATSGNGNHNGNGNGNGGSGGNTKTCDEGKSHDPDPRGNAYGFFKNKLGTTIALVKAMAANDPAFNLHHSTDIDNDTAHGLHIHDPGDHDSSCAAAEEEHDKA